MLIIAPLFMVWLDSTSWTFHEGVYSGTQNISWDISVPQDNNYTINVQTSPASVGFSWCETDRERLSGQPPWVVGYAPKNLTCLPAQRTAGVLPPTVVPVNMWPVKPRIYPTYDTTTVIGVIIGLAAGGVVLYLIGESLRKGSY